MLPGHHIQVQRIPFQTASFLRRHVISRLINNLRMFRIFIRRGMTSECYFFSYTDRHDIFYRPNRLRNIGTIHIANP